MVPVSGVICVPVLFSIFSEWFLSRQSEFCRQLRMTCTFQWNVMRKSSIFLLCLSSGIIYLENPISFPLLPLYDLPSASDLKNSHIYAPSHLCVLTFVHPHICVLSYLWVLIFVCPKHVWTLKPIQSHIYVPFHLWALTSLHSHICALTLFIHICVFSHTYPFTAMGSQMFALLYLYILIFVLIHLWACTSIDSHIFMLHIIVLSRVWAHISCLHSMCSHSCLLSHLCAHTVVYLHICMFSHLCAFISLSSHISEPSKPAAP